MGIAVLNNSLTGNSITGLLGFSDSDIIVVLKRAFDETQENRKKALDVYDDIATKMKNSDANLAIMGSFAQNYLDVATKQTSELVKLVGVMQRLKATKTLGENPGLLDGAQIYSQVIQQLDDAKITPYNDITDKDMNYKDDQKEKIKTIETNTIIQSTDNNIIQTKKELLGLSDLNLDELETEI